MLRRRLVLGLSIASLGAVLVALALVVSGREDEEPLATINEGSGTYRGIGVGDDLERAEAVYARVTCGDAPSGDFGSYPYCAGVIASQPGRRRLYTWFGEDPIASITISTSLSTARNGRDL